MKKNVPMATIVLATIASASETIPINVSGTSYEPEFAIPMGNITAEEPVGSTNGTEGAARMLDETVRFYDHDVKLEYKFSSLITFGYNAVFEMAMRQSLKCEKVFIGPAFIGNGTLRILLARQLWL